VGSYAKLRKHEWLQGYMQVNDLNPATVAKRCTYEQHRKVSRQMISALANGTKSSCSPELAEAICKVLNVPIDSLFVVDSVRNQITRNTARKSAA
jgi:DNA-binding XRE family transcriptional regulator